MSACFHRVGSRRRLGGDHGDGPRINESDFGFLVERWRGMRI